jgi:hypothetical protein
LLFQTCVVKLGVIVGVILAASVASAALPPPDRTIRAGQTQYHQHPGSETCVPVTVMNAARMLRGRFTNPNAVLRKLTRIGRTEARSGTNNGGMRRQARAIGLTTVPIDGIARAQALSARGIPIAASINPGFLPRRIQDAHGGPWASDPASHEVLIRKLDPRGAVIEDPEAGRYRLRVDELRATMGAEGDLHGFVRR